MPYIGNIVQDFSVNNAMLNTDSVTSIKIDDGTIVNADINDSAAIAMSKLALSITNSEVNASAAIAGTKISPDFGSQAISTTGTLACGDITSSDGNGNLTLKDNNHTGNNTEHKISFTASDNTDLINFISPFGEQHLRLRHGTTELVKFEIGGNVGIGTTSPSSLLHLHSGASSGGLQIQSNGSTNYFAAIQAVNNFITGAAAGSLAIRSSDGMYFSANDGSAVQMSLLTSGNVGIGTALSLIHI